MGEEIEGTVVEDGMKNNNNASLQFQEFPEIQIWIFDLLNFL